MANETIVVDAGEQTLYELTFLQAEEGIDPVQGVLKERGIIVRDERPLEKVRLAYPMGGHSYAFMGSLRFTAPGGLAGLSTDLSLRGGVIRSLVHRVAPSAERAEDRTASRSGAAGDRLSRAPAADAPLTNEALERKISEILQ